MLMGRTVALLGLLTALSSGCGSRSAGLEDRAPLDAGSDAPRALQCGGQSCSPSDVVRVSRLGEQGPLPACCAPNGACGYDLSDYPYGPLPRGCVAVDNPGVLDESCPSLFVLIPHGSSELAGCRRPDGTCGLDVTGVGFGFDLGCIVIE